MTWSEVKNDPFHLPFPLNMDRAGRFVVVVVVIKEEEEVVVEEEDGCKGG